MSKIKLEVQQEQSTDNILVLKKNADSNTLSALRERSENWKTRKENIFSPQLKVVAGLLQSSSSHLRDRYNEQEEVARSVLQKGKDRNEDDLEASLVVERRGSVSTWLMPYRYFI